MDISDDVDQHKAEHTEIGQPETERERRYVQLLGPMIVEVEAGGWSPLWHCELTATLLYKHCNTSL